MQVLHVDKVDRRIENGCTEPFLAVLNTGSDQIHAVIKTKNNVQGILSVVNEWISYKLAIALEILMPESGIAQIDDNTDTGNFVDKSDFGNCFYSKYIQKASIPNENVMEFVANKDSYEKIILFDHLVYNTDRNKGNLLIFTGKGDKLLYAIDHTHVFKNQTIWDRQCLIQGIQANDFLNQDILVSNGYVYFFRSKNINLDTLKLQASVFMNILKKELLEEIVDSIPVDWKINKADLDALVKYLLYRSEHLYEICEMIAQYKEWR